ncbi:HTH-type sugar sensing transcriptional regulator TrmBL1 [Candidatus Tiddalikarchaeum anstoanum]|nr:HTH-type sugar sensing transcriptional regulator TrmBL1 [Candidatus Tiddalikarchaeum anstoanum]
MHVFGTIMMQDVLNSLKRIGLTGNEAKVYYTLLKNGESKAGGISKNAGINRTTTYDALKGLVDKGLANYVIKSSNKYFKGVEPDRLFDFIKEKEMYVEKALPKLKSIYSKPDSKNNVSLYQGYNGIKSVFQDIIRTLGRNGTNLVMDSEGQFAERMPFFAPHFIKQLEDYNINVKHIVRRGHDVKPSKTTEVKFIDKNEKSEASIDIFGDKLAIIVWTEPPEAVVIENKSLSESMKYYFSIIWDNI